MTVALARQRPDDVRAQVAHDPERQAQLRLATSELLDRVETSLNEYVVFPTPAASTVTALYVLHTWTIDAADATPYLIVVSNEPGSGKTRLLEVLGLLVRRPWHTSATTEVAMFRKIDQEHPTLLLDELDTIFRGGRRHEALRAIINAGNRRGSTVTRCDGSYGTREYETFGAKVMAGIDTGFIPDTILDRSIVIRMRKRDSEQLRRLRGRQAMLESAPLVATLGAWATIVHDQLAATQPDLPDELSDRQADAWEPLLAIAEYAGGTWPQKALSATETGPGGDGTPSKVDSGAQEGILPALEALLAVSQDEYLDHRAEQLLAQARQEVQT